MEQIIDANKAREMLDRVLNDSQIKTLESIMVDIKQAANSGDNIVVYNRTEHRTDHIIEQLIDLRYDVNVSSNFIVIKW